MPARITFRHWLVGLAVIFFLAGAFFRISAASGFAVISPSPDSVLSGQSITLTFSLPDYLKVVDYQTHPRAAFGQGHLHLWIDQTPDPATAIHVISATHTLSHLKYGPHTVTAELVTNDHASLIPKTTASVTFTTVPPSPLPGLYWPLLSQSVLAFIVVAAALSLVSFYQKRFISFRPAPKSKPKTKSKTRRSSAS